MPLVGLVADFSSSMASVFDVDFCIHLRNAGECVVTTACKFFCLTTMATCGFKETAF